jgi:hypothetical protein
VLLLVPVVVVVGALALPQVRGVVQQFPGWAKAVVFGVLGLTMVGLMAVGGHMAIRAFELGRTGKGTQRVQGGLLVGLEGEGGHISVFG